MTFHVIYLSEAHYYRGQQDNMSQIYLFELALYQQLNGNDLNFETLLSFHERNYFPLSFDKLTKEALLEMSMNSLSYSFCPHFPFLLFSPHGLIKNTERKGIIKSHSCRLIYYCWLTLSARQCTILQFCLIEHRSQGSKSLDKV